MYSPVRVSDIGQYLRCPRLVYFDHLEALPKKEDAGRMLLKSLMLSPLLSGEGTATEKADLSTRLKAILAGLELELPLVYNLTEEEIRLACSELEGEIESIACGLAGHLDRLLPCQAEVDLHSERLGLSGRLDRVAPGAIPSIIRTGQAPVDGIWKKDRLMLSGYALLLGEREGVRIDRGMVEYWRCGQIRDVQIYAVDKARVLRLRDRIRVIKEGRLPDRAENAPCEGCRARKACETKHSLLSRFF